MIPVHWRPQGAWNDPKTDERASTGRFRSKDTRAGINLNRTLNELDSEAVALGASDVIIELDLPSDAFFADGSGVKGNRRGPDFPGVIVRLIGTRFGDLRYVCDAFDQQWSVDPPGWQGNLRAVVLGLNALRLVERYGIGTRGEQYAGWAQLPPGMPMGAGAAPPKMTLDNAAAVLAGATDGLVTAPDVLAEPEDAKLAYRMASKRWHPDVPGGSPETWAKVDEAWRLVQAHHYREGT